MHTKERNIIPSLDDEADIGPARRGFYRLYLKRPLDVLISLVSIVLLSPVLATVAALVWRHHGRPVLFSQDRPGLHSKVFTLYKFRSMTNQTDADGNLLPVGQRKTAFGEALRRTSLDELPELLAILKGDMSFIGPRPLLVQYLPHYTAFEKHRHDVRPGLSGLAQVNGRNLLKWEDRFRYDVEYVRNITFLGDLKIIVKTFVNVVKKSGIVTQGEDYEIDFDLYRLAQLAETAREGGGFETGNR